jgi:hypothetical protein
LSRNPLERLQALPLPVRPGARHLGQKHRHTRTLTFRLGTDRVISTLWAGANANRCKCVSATANVDPIRENRFLQSVAARPCGPLWRTQERMDEAARAEAVAIDEKWSEAAIACN